MKSLLNNWSLKLTALLLAIALWSHVRGEVNPLETASFTVKLRADAPPKFAFDEGAPIPETVRVTLRAPRVRLREIKGGVPTNPLAPPDEAPSIAPRYINAYLSFQNPKAGQQSVPVKIENSVEDAEILGVKPSDLIVNLRAE